MVKILVIEDNPVMRRLAVQILSDAGHDLIDAEDGQKGLDSFWAHRPEILVTDILMPEREGLEIILELRRLVPGLPIIAISGAATYLDVAKQFGADAVVLKPFRVQELVAAVNRLLALERCVSSPAPT